MKEQLTSMKDRLASVEELLNSDIGQDVLTSDKGLPFPITKWLARSQEVLAPIRDQIRKYEFPTIACAGLLRWGLAFAWPWPGVCAAGLRGSSSSRIWRESGVAPGRGELRATFAEIRISNEGF